jgi:thiol-disulfide isomerase/thioredoxin
MFERCLIGIVVFAALPSLAAKDREPAPAFRAKTLTGDSFSNDSVSGSVVLLQFWTTWCPYCRREQPMIDRLGRELADKGVVVLAVDVAESEKTVREYLDQSPRTVPIVLSSDTNLVQVFEPHVFPMYVVMDRQGNVAYVQRGAAGEQALRSQLRRAGVDSAPGASKQAVSDSYVQVITAPAASIPVKPPGPAVFVLNNGQRLEAQHYTLTADSLRTTIDGQPRTIPLSALDLKATVAANRERGIDLKIPSNRSEISLGP